MRLAPPPRHVLAVALLVLCGCAYRPAKFADRPLILRVTDDRPSPPPDQTDYDELLHVSDIYLRRPIFDALSPADPATAGDINALDEVPSSTWFQQPIDLALTTEDRDAPLGGTPRFPLTLLEASPALGDGLAVVDARGARYEIRRDTAQRPELRTGAAAVASRLLRAVGLRTPDVWVLGLRSEHVRFPAVSPDAERALRARFGAFLAAGPPAQEGAHRISATRWPIGIDIGIATDFGTRRDDPNDLIRHNDRRTLRSLKVIGAWLGFDGFGRRFARDAYVGKPGEGHVLHYVVEMERALGAGSVVDPLPRYQPLSGARGEGVLQNLVSFGFAPAPRPVLTQRRFLSLGTLGPLVNPKGLEPSLPYGPFVRLSRADAYWAAKRIASLTPEALATAVAAARFSDPDAQAELLLLISLRARQVVGHWFHQVTPCELVGTEGTRILLRDEAIFRGYSRVDETSYRVAFLDDDGDEIAPSLTLVPSAPIFGVEIPGRLLRRSDPVVLHLTVSRRGKSAPAACDVHVAMEPDIHVFALHH